MKLSTRSRYGLKACFELALDYNRGALSLANLESRTGVSKIYLEQLFRLLVKKSIIYSERGANGGYKLSQKPEEITIGMIIRALEKDMIIVDCINGGCDAVSCPTKSIWTKLYTEINRVLDNITLQNMIDDFNGEKNNG